MKLTKFEQDVLSPQYPRKCRLHYLYLGLAFIAVGIIIVVNGYTKSIPQVDALWQRNISVMEQVNPTTENEKLLRDMVINTLDMAKEGWNNFLKEKSRSTSSYFIFFGLYLLGAFFREKRYRKLTDKLYHSNVKKMDDMNSN